MIVILDYDLLKDNGKFFKPMISSKAVTKILYGNFEKSFLKCEKWLCCGVKRTPHCCQDLTYIDLILLKKTIASTWRKKYAQIFVRGHYLFWEAKSLPRAKLEESCVLCSQKEHTDSVLFHNTLTRNQLFNRGMGALIERQGGGNLSTAAFDHEFQAIRVGWEGRCDLLFWALDQYKRQGRFPAFQVDNKMKMLSLFFKNMILETFMMCKQWQCISSKFH